AGGSGIGEWFRDARINRPCLETWGTTMSMHSFFSRLWHSPILRRPGLSGARMQFVDSAVKEDEIRYHALSVAAHELSQWIAAGPRPIESGSAICLWKAAVESVLHPPRNIGAPTFEGRDGAVFEALSKLR